MMAYAIVIIMCLLSMKILVLIINPKAFKCTVIIDYMIFIKYYILRKKIFKSTNEKREQNL